MRHLFVCCQGMRVINRQYISGCASLRLSISFCPSALASDATLYNTALLVNVHINMVGRPRLELGTCGLKVRCSTC